MTHTPVIQINELFRSFHAIVFFRMIEPSRTNGYVTFGRNPLVTVCMSVLQFIMFGISGIYFSFAQE